MLSMEAEDCCRNVVDSAATRVDWIGNDMGEMRLPFPASVLLDGASRIHQDPLTPLRVSASTFAFLHQLSRLCDAPEKPLAQFLLSHSIHAVEEELMRMLVPANVVELRIQHERFQVEKEEAVANRDFHHAALLRDAADAIESQIPRLLGTLPEVGPHDFTEALRNLGFDGSFDD